MAGEVARVGLGGEAKPGLHTYAPQILRLCAGQGRVRHWAVYRAVLEEKGASMRAGACTAVQSCLGTLRAATPPP